MVAERGGRGKPCNKSKRPGNLTYRLAFGHDRPNQRLSGAVPAYERTGRAATLYWLNHSVKGLGLTADELDERATWSDLVSLMARKLESAVLLFRCTDVQEVHFYVEWGSGTCRIDGTPLEST